MMDRFLRNVDKRADGCWLWTRSVNSHGYGAFWNGKQMVGAHRVAHELFIGPVPEGAMVMHSCDVRHCVNPDHLSAGTHGENMKDMVERGRHLDGVASRSPLSVEDVHEIRARASRGETHQSIADDFGLARVSVTNIVNRHRWGHV